MSIRVGLTGGLASGKTSVARMFAARGAYVFYADSVAHDLMNPGEPVYAETVKSFGESIVRADGSIDRQKLAEIAFGSGRIEELNLIVHPAVIAKMEEWMRQTVEDNPRAVLVMEAALILEAGMGKYFDVLVVVSSTAQQKLERFASRMLGDSIADEGERLRAMENATKRLGAQLSQEEKVAAADYVIDNSGTLPNTERQVAKLYRELQRMAAA
jgi:dephospho-CoA kinase